MMVETKKLRDARAMHCEDCDQWWSDLDPVPWGLRQTRWMHERGCPDHKVRLYAYEDEEADE